jgi:hypothetical protein
MVESTKMKTFNDYTAFGALDVVLKVIYEVDTGMWGISMEEIYIGLQNNENTQFAYQEIKILLDQMIRDKNLEEVKKGFYKLSLSGRFLHLRYGYSQKEILRVADEARLKFLSTMQVQQGTALVHLNRILAIGASIASVYYLMEIGKEIHKNWDYIVDFFCRCQ